MIPTKSLVRCTTCRCCTMTRAIQPEPRLYGVARLWSGKMLRARLPHAITTNKDNLLCLSCAFGDVPLSWLLVVPRRSAGSGTKHCATGALPRSPERSRPKSTLAAHPSPAVVRFLTNLARHDPLPRVGYTETHLLHSRCESLPRRLSSAAAHMAQHADSSSAAAVAAAAPALLPDDAATSSPAPASALAPPPPAPARRAKKACKTCNMRRVRCNVMEKQPCSNCETAKISCELLVSRRGKYVWRLTLSKKKKTEKLILW